MPNVILDNLYAEKKIVPMIVVMPNGRASKELTARDPIPKQSPAFALFEKELLTDLIPFIEKTFSARTDRESRAIAGLSMGGGQALNFGLNNLDTFGWVGGFSSAPNTRQPVSLIKDHAEAAKKLRLLYVACGDKDGLFRISQGVHKMLEEKKVPHVYRVIPGGGHDFRVWRSDLYHFAQLLFGEPAQEGRRPPRRRGNRSRRRGRRTRAATTRCPRPPTSTTPVICVFIRHPRDASTAAALTAKSASSRVSPDRGTRLLPSGRTRTRAVGKVCTSQHYKPAQK